MNLGELQREFRASLLAEGGGTVGLGMAVYHNAYRVQLTDCLKEAFRQLLKWLGDEKFDKAALVHIETTPSCSWTLGDYGEGFDRSIASLYPDDPEVTELAWLEWQMTRAFIGCDATPLDVGALGEIDWDRAKLSFVPTLRLGELATNAGAIWSALATETMPPAGERLHTVAAVVVWRHEFLPCFRTIELSERDALERMLAGASFGELCQTLVARLGPDEGVRTAGEMLGAWLRDGMIASIEQ